MSTRTPARTTFCVALILLVMAAAACAWAIFTSGSVTQNDDPPAIPCIDTLIPLADSPSWVLVDLVMPDGDNYEDAYVLITTPPPLNPPDTFYAPLLTVLDPSGRYSDHKFILLDEELVELVEIEIGELLEDWSPWEEYFFNLNDH